MQNLTRTIYYHQVNFTISIGSPAKIYVNNNIILSNHGKIIAFHATMRGRLDIMLRGVSVIQRRV